MSATPFLVDTNLVVYLLMASDQTEKARQLYQKNNRWVSESFMPIELTSAFIQGVRTGRITEKQAVVYVEQAMELFPPVNLVKADHAVAMQMALKYKTSAYDARYLAIAEELNTCLITQDKPLRAAAPELTMSLDEALAQ